MIYLATSILFEWHARRHPHRVILVASYLTSFAVNSINLLYPMLRQELQPLQSCVLLPKLEHFSSIKIRSKKNNKHINTQTKKYNNEQYKSLEIKTQSAGNTKHRTRET